MTATNTATAVTTTMMKKAATVNVTITSDLMCPWCWIGLKKLQEAVVTWSKNNNNNNNNNNDNNGDMDKKVHIEWKPFMLRPYTPIEGTPKGGTPTSRVGHRLKQAGQAVGIDFTGLTDRTPNTTLFHATIKYLQDELVLDPEIVTGYHEAVFEGYFTIGIYPDQEGLLKAANKCDDTVISKSLETLFRNDDKLVALEKAVTEEALNASRRGVSGVPTFAFNGHTAFSGAQPVDTFIRYLEHFSTSQQDDDDE